MNKYHPTEIVFSCLVHSAKRPNLRQFSFAASFLLCTDDRALRYKIIGVMLVAPIPLSRSAASILILNEGVREIKSVIHHFSHGKRQYRDLLHQSILKAHNDAPRIDL